MNRLKQWLVKFLKKGDKDVFLSTPEAFGEYCNKISLTNPFRQLTGKESEAVNVIDNREMYKSNSMPNN
jgi:hypothetical protein